MKAKSYSILLTIFLFITVIKADEITSSLNISLYDGGKFTVEFNNAESSQMTDEMEYNNIEAGKYYLKVIKESRMVPATPDIIFSDYIIIPQNCKIYAVIDESGHFLIYKKINDFSHYADTHTDECKCNCEYCQKCIYKTGNIGLKEHHEEQLNDDCKHKSMDGKDFESALKTISDKSFEITKIDIAKQIVDANTITCEQLREILKAFSFEDSKIQLSEYAYDKLCDPKNFSKIYDVFTFESSIQTLQEFTAQKK